MTTLRGPRVVLRPVTESDVPVLLAILRQPEVACRFSAPDDVGDRELLLGEGALADERLNPFVICLDGETVGWVVGWEKLDPEYRHAGVDIFLSPKQHRRGLGPEAIRLVCRFLFDERRHHRITIDPAADNARAIAAYEKVGFKRVGILRRYELGPDGQFHDGMLLDLLREDLTDEPPRGMP